MENLKQIQDEILVCPMCHEQYKGPKVLPCLHSFCRSCLTEDLEKITGKNLKPEENATSEENGASKNSKLYNCPVCKADIHISIPSGNNNTDQWADLFPDNNFIQNMIEKIEMLTENKNCESCTREDNQDQAKAEVWCQTCKVAFCEACIKAHNIIKACREHQVMPLNNMRQDPIESIKENKKEIACPYHREKIIEYYCVDCHVTICSSCVAMQHRRCEIVETIREAVQKLAPEKDYITKDIEVQSKVLEEWEKEHIRELSELKTNKENLIKEMSGLRKKVNEVLLNLENKLVDTLDQKHKDTIVEVNDRLKDVEEMKKTLMNTSRFMKYLTEFGSDSELVSVFDVIKVQTDDMRSTIQKAKTNKLNTRFKLAIDPAIQRVLEMKSLGKIVDMVDLNANGLKNYQPVERSSSIKRTGTFRVEKPVPPPSSLHSSSSASSTSNESISSQEMAPTRPRRNQPIKPSLRESMGIKTPRPSETPSAGSGRKTPPVRSGTMPRTIRVQRPPSVTRTKSSGGLEAVKEKNGITNIRATTPSNVRDRPTTPSARLSGVLSPRTARKEAPQPPPRPKSAGRQSSTVKTPSKEEIPIDDQSKKKSTEDIKQQSPPKSKGLPLMFTFNGRTDGDAKKCWPLDVAVLEDGTPVITDFHNKKIKAFDATGTVMGESAVPSWPHGLVDVSSCELAVTLPELSTIMFVVVQETSMRIRKRIRTSKQYRGVSCDAITCPGNPSLVVTCCAAGMQCVDVLTLDGVLIQTYRDDYRHKGQLLFTWPYYVTCNTQGEVVVSDCQSKNGIICLYRDGKVRYEANLSQDVIKDPRGICTDRFGNIFIADKTGNTIHCLDNEGKYKSILINQTDGLQSPIAVCLSPFGQLVVTQENGDIKVYKHS
ncbi:E3 ubiquitin-protein ligase TRIM33-like [Saccostrea echinata]|uniref:E3 ubiquitin-protein ligase TRIM33-like n=1 Tax=Saccostrea echinata TaxID=191078 RepID=UPI002A8122B6|nr:E3 ubiquitin-protein ligase TRIM33-like [Saccostrea echinata]XP_061189282.1 E3 ubiquitin-protein ligase TRIM33-like [Saccostrea echinata]